MLLKYFMKINLKVSSLRIRLNYSIYTLYIIAYEYIYTLSMDTYTPGAVGYSILREGGTHIEQTRKPCKL